MQTCSLPLLIVDHPLFKAIYIITTQFNGLGGTQQLQINFDFLLHFKSTSISYLLSENKEALTQIESHSDIHTSRL
jgi:hypothetical protein